MDFGKMKVIELRAELQARGLDTKGVKAALIDRLKEALDLEEQQAGGAPRVVQAAIAQQTPGPDTPRSLRRSSRSRTKSPEPVSSAPIAQDTTLPAVTEEPEEQKEEENDLERIIDDTEPEQQQQQDYDEDALLEDEESEQQQSQSESQEQQQQSQQQNDDEQMDTTESGGGGGGGGDQNTEDENRGVKRRSDSPSKGNSPKKRQRLPPPNIDDFVNDEDEPELDENKIQLSWFDSDLNLKIDRETFCSAVSLSDTGLALVWAGARANYGAINNGKYFYEVQLLAQNTKISYPNERNLHELRCGWSTSNSPLQLGESEHSFGFDSSGRKCCNAEFTDYGVKLNVLDVVGVHLELNDDKCTVQYTINGKDQGVAFEFEKSALNEQALFPHIVTKNIEFKVNFGQSESSLWSARREAHKESELQRRRKDLERKKKDLERKREEKLKKQQEAAAAKAAKAEETTENAETSEEKPAEEKTEAAAEEKQPEAPVEEEKEEEPEPVLPDDISEAEVDQDTPHENRLAGYLYINQTPVDQLSKGPRRPDARTDCEVIMMIGLPGAGKSHWALQRAKEFPEKRYTLLGTKYLLEKMRINGQPRKPNSGPGRWEKLIELCNRGLLTLNEIACKRRRNFILDQPHVYISDQRRKMRVYGDFKRIAAIVVPNEEEYKKRIKLRLETEGKDIPDSAVNEMRANITLPELEYQWFNEILYTDLEKEPATEEVSKENERGKKALNQRNRQNNFRGGRDFNNRNDRRWGGGNNRNDFRRNWGPPNQPPRNMGGNFRGGRDFDFNGGRGRNNWNGPDNWMNRPRGGYGGAPPPRPGQKGRQPDNNNRNRNDRRDFRQGGGGGGGGNNNRNNNRRPDGNKKFGGKNDWNSQGGPWGGNNWGNNFGGGNQTWGNNQWNQNQYGGTNSSTDNSNDTSQQWMAYYQQQQQQQPQAQTQQVSQNWYSDQNYGGAFSSNSNYDSNQQTKQ